MKNVYTKEHLIDCIREHAKTKFPVQRDFRARNGLPCYSAYYNKFGSFKNAIIISGIEIPEERKRFFDREKLSDEEMLSLLKYYNDEKQSCYCHEFAGTGVINFLLTHDEIDENKNMPHSSTYTNRFKTIENMYKLIGIDKDSFEREKMQLLLLNQYKKLSNKINRYATSRHLDYFSNKFKDEYFSTTTYYRYFNSLYDIYDLAGYWWIEDSRNFTDEELLFELKQFCNSQSIYPTQKDIDNSEYITCGSKMYSDRFGSIENSVILCGADISKLIKTHNRISSKGICCSSYYEYVFCNMLEVNDVKFTKENLYKDYIDGYKNRHRFDFVIYIKDEPIFIELFCYADTETYLNTKKLKISLCKENNLTLIQYDKNDFSNCSYEYLYSDLCERLDKIGLKLDAKEGK